MLEGSSFSLKEFAKQNTTLGFQNFDALRGSKKFVIAISRNRLLFILDNIRKRIINITCDGHELN